MKIPWGRTWQPTTVLLPEKSHGQRSLVGYSPWGHKESDTTKWLTFSLLHFHNECLDIRKVKLCTIIVLYWLYLINCQYSSCGLIKVLSHSVMSGPLQPCGLSPPGSSVRGILQARILEWVVMSLSRGSSQPRKQTRVFYIAGTFFTNWAVREAPTK